MNDLQATQLKILKYFISFCDKHNITYFLCGGTCLGAVRHQGFIPWDDDIDVAIPREEYDRFIELATKEMNVEGSDYFLQTHETDKYYLYNFAKVRLNTTTFVEKQFKFANMNQGVWIDVFPWDGMSLNENYKKRELKRIHRNWFYMWASYPRVMYRKIRKKHFFKDFFANFAYFILYPFTGLKSKRAKIEKIMRKVPYEKSFWTINAQGAIKAKPVPRHVIGDGVMFQFEDIKARIPTDYDTYLSIHYGDYMKLPPLDKQSGHHFYEHLDLNMSWRDFKKDYRKW